MKNIWKTLKERMSGLVLLLFAVFIIAGISLSSHQAESKNAQNLSSGDQISENQASDSTQVLGETNNSQNEVAVKPEETIADTVENNSSQNEKTEVKKNNAKTDSQNTAYDELKSHLEKYCGKNFDVKKCRDYLLEAKDASKKSAKCRALYKKYHFEKKDNTGSSNNDTSTSDATDSTSTDTDNNTINLTITAGGDSNSYSVVPASDASVIDMMDLLQANKENNFSYHVSSGFVDKINGTESQGDMSWMLYLCKNDTCKLSSVGAADSKIKDWDKIEWKYVDWMTMSWDMW